MTNKRLIKVPVMAEIAAQDKKPEYLFWVGSAGSYDDRVKKITRAFTKILEYCKVDYAVLGTEETDSGEVARRAGNEFLFQMQAMQIIETLKMYDIKKIITCDPHEFNTFKNEYPDLGGNYEVLHHTQIIDKLIREEKLSLDDKKYNGKRITYHDPCYLGRGNDILDEPRFVLSKLNSEMIEMQQNRYRSLCCGGGGAQMFKEAEKGDKEVYELRTEQALEKNPNVIATACPFCMTMMQDGLKMKDMQDKVEVLDIAEIIERSLGL